jgi:hypothetical protein
MASVPQPGSVSDKEIMEPLSAFVGVLFLENLKLGVRIQRFNDVERQESDSRLQ